MAGRTLQRQSVEFLRKVGEEPVVDLLRAGFSVHQLCETLGIVLNGYYAWLGEDPDRKDRLQKHRDQGKADRADRLLDEGLSIVDDPGVQSKEEIMRARVRSDYRLRLAEKLNPNEYGNQKNKVQFNVNVGDLHLTALRQLQPEGERALPAPVEEGDYEVVG
jgi:hypothetical protein